MNVYAITPTGNRREGMAMLAEYLNAQTYQGPLTWIVVDDCDPPTRIPGVRPGVKGVNIRPGWRWEPGQNTQAACMGAALEEVPDDALLVILEDDDIYMPEYLTAMIDALQTADLVGERDPRYYNVATRRWQVCPARRHSSMASTACKGPALAELKAVCSVAGRQMLDTRLWRQFDGEKRLLSGRHVVSIKGMPGRPGIGVGHQDRFGKPDTGNKLREWAGDYADNYDIFRRDR